MSFTPLLAADNTIIIHAFAALAALVLGVIQLAGPKGTAMHRIIGWSWVVLMAIIAISSFNIQVIKQFGPFSLIHLLSVLVLVMLPLAIFYARKRNIIGHRKTMTRLFLGGLVVAGIFTLMPGRVMNAVVFGEASPPAAVSLDSN